MDEGQEKISGALPKYTKTQELQSPDIMDRVLFTNEPLVCSLLGPGYCAVYPVVTLMTSDVHTTITSTRTTFMILSSSFPENTSMPPDAHFQEAKGKL